MKSRTSSATSVAGPATSSRAPRRKSSRAIRICRGFAVSCGFALSLLWTAPAAQAGPVTYAFSGVFDVPNGSLNIYTDKPFEGSFTYDPTIAPRAQAQPGAAQYDALMAFDLEILDVPSEFAVRIRLTPGAPTAEIGVDERTNGAPSDAFTIYFGTGPRGKIETPYVWDAFSLLFRLEQVAGSVWDDALSLPSSLDLGEFDRTLVRLLVFDGGVFFNMDGRITSLELMDTPPIDVPEPGTLGLVGVAAGGLAAVAGRRRRGGTAHRSIPFPRSSSWLQVARTQAPHDRLRSRQTPGVPR
jgi:hypothetical protein